MAVSSRSLFGTATEYAVTALDAAGCLLPVDGIVLEILERAAALPASCFRNSSCLETWGTRETISRGPRWWRFETER